MHETASRQVWQVQPIHWKSVCFGARHGFGHDEKMTHLPHGRCLLGWWVGCSHDFSQVFATHDVSQQCTLKCLFSLECSENGARLPPDGWPHIILQTVWCHGLVFFKKKLSKAVLEHCPNWPSVTVTIFSGTESYPWLDCVWVMSVEWLSHCQSKKVAMFMDFGEIVLDLH